MVCCLSLFDFSHLVDAFAKALLSARNALLHAHVTLVSLSNHAVLIDRGCSLTHASFVSPGNERARRIRRYVVTTALALAAILPLLGFLLFRLTLAPPLLLLRVELVKHAWHLDLGLAGGFDVGGLGLELVAAARRVIVFVI